MKPENIQKATDWLEKELRNFDLVIGNKRVRVIVEEIIKILEKE